MRNGRPRIYIAAPFFNEEQRSVVSTIEETLNQNGLPFYSPRLHSGSTGLSLEERKDPAKWVPVFQSNVQELQQCDLMLAVLAYLQPMGRELAVIEFDNSTILGSVELPDNGVCYEIGRYSQYRRPIVGFHPFKRSDQMNLMLTHGCHAFISGFPNLYRFFDESTSVEPLMSARFRDGIAKSCATEPLTISSMEHLHYFNWAACDNLWKGDIE